MPGRSYNSAGYRYGFNGQQKDDEVYGSGNINTAEFWQYDTRLGRRWNVDPVVKPWESGYATFYNNPIAVIDPLGLSGTTTTDEQGCVEYSGDATNSSTGETQNVQVMTPEQMNDFSLVPSASEAIITADRIDHPINEPNGNGGVFSSSPMIMYNGILREYYVNQASKLRPFYDNANPLNPSNQYGLDERVKLKTWVRNNSIAGANKILDVLEGPVEQKPLINPKTGDVTRFYYTNPNYNTLSRIGTAASVYGMVVSVKRIANSKSPVEETVRVGAGWAGAWGAMSIGAPVAGKVGVLVTAGTANPAIGAGAAFGVELILGVAGGIGGEAGMNWAMEKFKH